MLKRYKKQKEKCKQTYKQKLKEIRYWNKIEHLFIKNKRKKKYEFSHLFKHEFYYDDEGHIENIANTYGYKISYENITAKNTFYLFRQK